MRLNNNAQKIGLIALALLLVAAAAVAIVQSRRADRFADATEAALRGAMYESAELLGGLQGSLLKLPASADPAREQLLLNDIARQAFGVQEHLATLPNAAQDLQGALKFVNQVQDYAETLTARLGAGGALTSEDQRQLSTLAQSAQQLQSQLLGAAETLSPIDFSAPTAISGTKDQPPSVEYPTLIYDGPFSDGAQPGAIPLQGGEMISPEQAQSTALAYVGVERAQSIRYLGERSMPAPCHEFEISDGRQNLTVCITKEGGHVLYMLTDGAVSQITLGESECIDAAGDFLSARGYGEMLPTYWATADGYCTINYAALQDGVLLYPDLVKVQVSMESGQVCGVEAANYLANHAQRQLEEPRVSQQQAQQTLSERLAVSGSRLCVIPTEPGEALAWEFSGEIEGVGSYLVYIDAMTGRELDILRLVETETGLETQ
ncbi:MAG: germination protein YpeB [Eubacteriales bacterium]|nr:germination protein YpeB [Eubacteriales bacterium]